MSKEYYTIEKKNNLGKQFVGIKAFEAIAINCINEIDEVEFEGGAMDFVTGSKSALDVKVKDSNQIVYKIDVVVKYGVNVNKIIKKLQNQIVDSVKEMIDINNIKINVNVQGINF